MLWSSLVIMPAAPDFFLPFSIAHTSKTQKDWRAALLLSLQVLHFNVESGKQIQIPKLKCSKLLSPSRLEI